MQELLKYRQNLKAPSWPRDVMGYVEKVYTLVYLLRFHAVMMGIPCYSLHPTRRSVDPKTSGIVVSVSVRTFRGLS